MRLSRHFLFPRYFITNKAYVYLITLNLKQKYNNIKSHSPLTNACQISAPFTTLLTFYNLLLVITWFILKLKVPNRVGLGRERERERERERGWEDSPGPPREQRGNSVGFQPPSFVPIAPLRPSPAEVREVIHTGKIKQMVREILKFVTKFSFSNSENT